MNKECLASLRFDNSRYDNILPEHRGSFEWIWEQDQYRDWSTSDASKLLYIQGKPGSGKSTFTKYFGDHLLEREPAAKSAIVAKFFYSHREGEPQRSHYNMFRSILYDILSQDETFFYHRFQTEYRAQFRGRLRANWSYTSLKEVLNSLQDHSLARRFYLIIDAVDESNDEDRRDVLSLLLDLCSNTRRLKIFVASRPVKELESRIGKVDNFIKLQDETQSDISRFAHSFLHGFNDTALLTKATNYIVQHAQGVFLWVKLVGNELLDWYEDGYSEEEIFASIERLPAGLERSYKRMFDNMTRETSDLQTGVRTFQFVLWTKRPLTVEELRHALAIPDNSGTRFTPSDGSFHKRIPFKQRIISCGRNFLEIKQHQGSGTICAYSLDPQD